MKIFATKLILLIFLILLIVTPAHAQNISYQGSTLWSGVCDVKIQGNYAYCAFFNGLMILDISNPDTPTFVSKYYIGGDYDDYQRRSGQNLFVLGDYVYFAADYLGMQIINVSDPANPTLSSIYTTQSYVSDVFVVDTLAYVSCRSSYLDILNVSDKTNPILIGHCPITSNCRGVYVQGNYAFVADDLAGLQIVDVSAPTNPVIVGNYDQSNYALDVVVSGNYAYVAWGYSGLVIVDVTDPANPVAVGHWSDPLNVWVDGIFINGGYAYLAGTGYGGGFRVIDISNPSSPIVIGDPWLGDWGLDVYVLGNRAYVATLQLGLWIFNISDPANPITAGHYLTSGPVNDVAVSGNYAYTACVASGLNIVDVADPTNPTVVRNWVDTSLYYSPMSVCVSGNYAYLGTYRGVRVLNISNPRSPIPLGKCDFPDNNLAKDIFVSEPYVYVADYSQGLLIINISDPAHPALTCRYSTQWDAMGVYVLGDYAYVADSYDLLILNISNPANPSLVGTLWLSTYAPKIKVRGSYAYLAADSHGVLIVDISDPANPTIISQFYIAGNPDDIALSGNYAYLSETRNSNFQGLQVVDVTDPANPTSVDSFRTAGEGCSIFVSGEYVYLTDNYSLMILHSNLTGIEDDIPIPQAFSLYQNYPNPFNALTTISYYLSKSGSVNLSIYNLLGEKVATISDGIQTAGEHRIIWNAKDFSSGIYFAKLESGEETKNIKMVLLK